MSRFDLDQSFEAEMLKDHELREHVEDRAEQAKRFAETFTPRGTDRRRGHARSAFRVERTGTGSRLRLADAFAHLIEWGSVNNRAYSPLRRGARAAGLDLTEDPRK